MFVIGDFARLGRVSVRMLRHYDSVGLLCPARVDEATGYRYYSASQLARLHRIVALKELGFSLRQVHELCDTDLPVAQLRGMLRLRRAELETEIENRRGLLSEVEGRLSAIDGELPAPDVVVKDIPAVRVAEMTAIAESYSPTDIAPVIGPLFTRVCDELTELDLRITGPGVACYENEGDGVRVHATVPVAADLGAYGQLTIVDLPPMRAACVVHHGSMDSADRVAGDLAGWIEHHGLRGTGWAREVNIACPPDPNEWVTEFQEPIRSASSGEPPC